jgi:hypothetical protein
LENIAKMIAAVIAMKPLSKERGSGKNIKIGMTAV